MFIPKNLNLHEEIVRRQNEIRAKLSFLLPEQVILVARFIKEMTCLTDAQQTVPEVDLDSAIFFLTKHYVVYERIRKEVQAEEERRTGELASRVEQLLAHAPTLPN